MNTPRILFRHMAKTGGTTLLNHFRSQLGADSMCVLGPHNRCNRFFKGLYQIEELEESVRAQYRVVQGHGVNDSAVALMRDADMRLMVVLREPVALVRSRYNHLFNAAKRKDLTVTPEIFMRKKACNSMATSMVESFPALVDPEADALLDKAMSVLRKFDYVFTTEGMNTQLSKMLQLYGMSEQLERKRVAEHKVPLPVSDSDILEVNDVDVALYTEVSRPTESDGRSHNALGFDAEGKRTAFDKILANAISDPATLQTRCYEELASALCRELRGEAAFAVLGAGKAPVADPDEFRAILVRHWAEKEANLSPEGFKRAKMLAGRQDKKFSRLNP